MSECTHGSLARSCELCDRDATIAELRRQLAEVTEELKECNTNRAEAIDLAQEGWSYAPEWAQKKWRAAERLAALLSRGGGG